MDNDILKMCKEVFDSQASVKSKEQLVWMIGNIAGEDTRYRNKIIEAGLLSKLCDYVKA